VIYIYSLVKEYNDYCGLVVFPHCCKTNMEVEWACVWGELWVSKWQ